MIPVTSSRIKQIGWGPVGSPDGNVGNLWVIFADGSTGYYSGVPMDIFYQLRDSPSKGSFLHDYVIKQGYPFLKTATGVIPTVPDYQPQELQEVEEPN